MKTFEIMTYDDFIMIMSNCVVTVTRGALLHIETSKTQLGIATAGNPGLLKVKTIIGTRVYVTPGVYKTCTAAATGV